MVVLRANRREASMTEVTTIGLDLAKNVFQAHGADAHGAPVFRKRLRRDGVLAFFAAQSPCRVAMEACPGAHHWGREVAKLGHEVRLIAPAYVKPFVKRQKNDAADAEAICEAAQRPTMRFVAVKSEAKQASAVIFRTRDVLVGQRTQIINAIRGHLAEYGFVAPQGPSHIERLIAQIEDPASDLPQAARAPLAVLVCVLRHLKEQTAALDTEIAARAKADEAARRLMTVPGIGPLVATAIEALAPPPETFRTGRDFAAWIGLTPLQHSTGGKERLGRTSRMGQRTLRRDHRVERGRTLGEAQGRAGRVLARPDADAQTTDAGDRGAGQQDRAHRLGAADARRNVPSSGRHRVGGAAARLSEDVRSSTGEYGATSVRRGRENQAHGERFERGPVMWSRPSYSIRARGRCQAASEAGHMPAADHAQCPPGDSSCTRGGVHTCPCGTPARQRSPRRERPRRRAILVDRPVSSMKTSLAGSRSGWASNQSSRRFRISGRSCSSAWADFF
jgi:transposase